MKAMVADLVALVFFVAIIYVLARPRSAAVDAVNAFSGAMVALVRTAVDI